MTKLVTPDAIRTRATLVASSLLERAKGRHGRVLVHRSLSRLAIGRSQLIQMLMLPVVFCGLIMLAEPYLMGFWRACILYWSHQLALPLQTIAQSPAQMALGWVPDDARIDMPGQEIWISTAMLTIMAFTFSRKLDREKLPLKYLVRILCFIQTLSLCFFLIAPSQFPYNVSDHIGDIVRVGYVLMFITPVMLALGYYLLNVHPAIKVMHTIFILLYFTVMIPHQIVLHALILHHFSLLFMPILYICFGAVFDVLIFVALYSWAASTLPARATI